MTNLSCAMALYKSGWIWLAVGMFGCCTCDTGATPAAGKPGSILFRSASATVPTIITTQNSQSTENRPVHVSFTQHLKVETTGIEGRAQGSATYHGSKQTKSTIASDPLSSHGNNESNSTNTPDPLSFHGNKETQSTNAPDPLSFHGNKETQSTNAPDPLSFHGHKETQSTNAPDPLSFHGHKETQSTNAPDPLSFHGNKETQSTNAPNPLSFHGNKKNQSTNAPDPLSFRGNKETKITKVVPCDWNITTKNNWEGNRKQNVSFAIPYRWNKTKRIAEDFLMSFNPGVCGYGRLPARPRITSPMPFPCECEPGCEAYDTCCDDNATDLVTASYTACTRSGWYVLAKCPAGWAGNDTVRDRCEKGLGGYPDEDPVSDFDSGVAYRNEWCALCHNVTRVTRWVVEVKCTYYQEVYSALTQRELLRLAVDHPDHCTVGSSPPRGVKTRSCDSRLWSGSRVVGTCKATGQWKAGRYSKDVAVNCRRYKALILRVFLEASESSIVIYQNLFCAICNDVLPVCVDGTWSRVERIGVRPFSFLLGLLDRDVHWGEQADRDCMPGQWLNHKNKCHNLTCVAGKVLKNDSCVTALDEICGLAYYLDMTLSPSQPLYVSSDNVSVFDAELEQKVNEKLEGLVDKFRLTIFIYTARYSHSPSLEDVFRVRITGDVHATRYVRRDDVEVSLVRALFHTHWDVVLDDNDTRVCLAQHKAYYPDRALIRSRILRLEYIHNQYFWTMTNTSFARNLLVTLTPVLTCPFLEFNHSQYDLRSADDRGNNTRLFLTSLKGETEVPDLRQTWRDGDTLYVCYDALKSLRRPARGSAGLDWQYVLTMVMMPLSMLGLLLTLAVYCLLPSLRTQPGLNTMSSCFALLVAQLSLLVAAHAQGTSARPWCRVLGAVVHAAWLNVFCWTSICSVHMYRAFSAETYHHGSLSAWRLVKETASNIGISVLVPAAVTGLVMVASHLLTDGRSLGYSDVSCFLDSALVVGLAMVLPASLLLSLNLTLFVLTVRRIHQVTCLQSEDTREAQRHVYACARLSLLTGMTWVVSLVAEGLNVDWLQLISIVVNGGQGILLLLSHLSTRRIAAMLVVKVGWKGQESSSSLQSTNTGLHSRNM